LRYKVILQPSAEEEIDAGYVYLVAEASVDVAERWFHQIEQALETLEAMPRRCPMAPESAYFEEEIRQLLVPPYRILFTITASEVHVLHVRHSSRRSLGEVDKP
jgi:plasmid stabilization system protein ParE